MKPFEETYEIAGHSKKDFLRLLHVYQQAIDRNIEQQGTYGNHHHGLGLVQARAVAVEHAVAGKGRKGDAGDVHKVFGNVAHQGL